MFIFPIILASLMPINISDVSAMDRRIPPVVALAIVEAVNSDEFLTPLMGSTLDEARLMVVYAREESGFRSNAVGDHGASLGLFQLQRLPRALAFDPTTNAREWLRRAHLAWEECGALRDDERLSSLVSGNCSHGHVLARHRVARASILLQASEVSDQSLRFF
jgi:hypothetical protein